jgi:hypothetical protein
MTSMARHEHDPEAHRKAAEKITFEKELCGDLIGTHLKKVPEEWRPYVRLTLDDMLIELRKLWQPNLIREWKRDPRGLLGLIAAAFERWEKASFERPLVLHQLAINPGNRPKDMSSYLEGKGIGASEAARRKSERQVAARRGADRKELERGSKPFRVPEKNRVPKEKADLELLVRVLAESEHRNCDIRGLF